MVRNTKETQRNHSQDYIVEHMRKTRRGKKNIYLVMHWQTQEGNHKKRTTLERVLEKTTTQGNSVARHREAMEDRRKRTEERIVKPLTTHQYLKRMMEQASRLLLNVDEFVSVFLLFFF